MSNSDDPTASPPPERGHKGRGTTQVELAKIEAEREVKLAEIAAAEHETTGERIARVLAALRPLAETCGKWTVGVLLAGCLALAVWYGRSLDLSAFGFGAKTGDAPAQPLTAGEDDTPPGPPTPTTDQP